MPETTQELKIEAKALWGRYPHLEASTTWESFYAGYVAGARRRRPPPWPPTDEEAEERVDALVRKVNEKKKISKLREA